MAHGHDHVHTDSGGNAGLGMIAGILIALLMALLVAVLIFGMGPWSGGAEGDESIPIPVPEGGGAVPGEGGGGEAPEGGGGSPTSMRFSLADYGFVLT